MSKYEFLEIHIDESIIESSDLNKLPGIKIDHKLIVLMIIFKIYAKKLEEKYEQQLEQPLTYIFKKNKGVNEFLFDAKFDYWPLIWMFHSCQNIAK